MPATRTPLASHGAFALPRSRTRVSFRGKLVVSLTLLLAGCAAPISVQQVGLRAGFEEQAANVPGTGRLSPTSAEVLERYDLSKIFRKQPEAAIAALHTRATSDRRRDTLFALAETSYGRGEKLRLSPKAWEPRRAPEFYLASAIYAYLFLFDRSHDTPPNPFDRQFRTACDLYNLGLARGLADREASIIHPTAGERPLPVGRIFLTVGTNGFPYRLTNFARFLPADAYRVRGAGVRLRDAGLGVPLIGVAAGKAPLPAMPDLPATVFLRVNGGLRELADGSATGVLEMFATFSQTGTRVGPQPVPLQTDITAPLAYPLQDSPLWDLGLKQFLSGTERFKSGIYLTQPYVPGVIPVVFVHGTMSNPLWWAEMWNTLRSDPDLRRHCQFWVYLYNTGNPLTYSAANFRDALTAMISELDPAGRDPALRQMVVIGHSQGGLLTKLAVTDTGDKLWRAINDKSADDLKLTPAQKAFVRRTIYFKPLPFVRRVVFICTPHRGSYLVKSWVQALAHRLIRLPSNLVNVANDLLLVGEPKSIPPEIRGRIPTSIDSMSPNNPVLRALADIPVAPGVASHSIIAIKGDGPPETGDDGVVTYASAHVDYAESEFIVRSAHSCQGNPLTIEEVRRILLEHLAKLPPGTLTPRPARTDSK